MCFSKLFGKKPDTTQLKPCGTIDVSVASSILLDKVESLLQESAEIYLPDDNIKIYNLEQVKKSQELEEVSNLKYEAEVMDCDDFAAELFGKFAGLVWTDLHALNFFFDENNTFWFLEPQTKKISQALDAWQGYKIRFLLGR